jgi:hypothetical protein
VLAGLGDAQRAVEDADEADHEGERVSLERLGGVLADLLAEHGKLPEDGADHAVGDPFVADEA